MSSLLWSRRYAVMMLVSSAIASAQETVQRIPYDYLGGSGLGPEELLNKLLLKPGTESTVISWAMVQSAQALQLSFTDKSSTEPALVPNVWHSTGEPVPLKDEVIARHNTEFPQLRLDPSITYGLQIQVHYFVANGNALTVGSKAVLFARGNNSPFKPFKRPYSGDFFARDFLSATLKKLDVLQKLQSPAWL